MPKVKTRGNKVRHLHIKAYALRSYGFERHSHYIEKQNPAVGVTGNLIYHADLFLQMLEGPEFAINKLYETILRR